MKKRQDGFAANIGKIEGAIGYTFRDKSLLAQAFTRTSFCNEHTGRGGLRYQSNEVLEFFGDGVLSLAIISHLLRERTERYELGIRTSLSEGDFSNIKSKLSDKKNLSECIYALGLQNYLRVGEGDAKLGIMNEPSVMEDLFESIVGAVYIDCDMNVSTVMDVVSRMLDVKLFTLIEPPVQSSKNALQEFCADKKRRLPSPTYKTVSESGPDHKKIYERAVYIGDRLVATATGKNMKLADSKAAELALERLRAEETATAPRKEDSNRPEKAKAEDVRGDTRDNGKSKTKKSTEGKRISEKALTEEVADKAKKQDNPTKNATRPTASASLKAYATSRKCATPTFKDMGEYRTAGKVECRVECIFMGKSEIGTGATRQEAKENAAEKIKARLGIGKAKKKSESKKESTDSKNANPAQASKNNTNQPSPKQKRKKANSKGSVTAPSPAPNSADTKKRQATKPKKKK